MRRLHEMSYVELEKHAIDIISELKIKAYGAGYEQGKMDAEMEAKRTKPAREFLEESRRETAQNKRDRIVERAKDDLDSLTTYFNSMNYKGIAYRVKPKQQLAKYAYAGNDAACHVDFIVNKEKRTVAALMRDVYSRKVYAKAIAKCTPDDCFNVHIGKAIALRRALGLEVPNEYLNAPQPTKVREGDVVTWNYPKHTYVITEGKRVICRQNGKDYTDYADMRGAKIVDDSREGGRRND